MDGHIVELYTYIMKEEYMDVLVRIIDAVVEHKESVKINKSQDEMGVLVTLSVHKEDMGQVIGKSGAMAQAIRSVMRVIGAKGGARVSLKILEPIQ